MVIGVLGGMGTYATINLFNRYAEVFPAEKEWERPRIVIDNRCTMPSRVRAYLYNENVDCLVDEMVDSMQHLVDMGCTRIILACNTSHLFLPYIYQKVPGLENKVLHIIKNCVEQIKNDLVKEVYLLGTEGTINSKIYQDLLEKEEIRCVVPSIEEFGLLRECIEAVKQNKYSENVKRIFLDFINRYDSCILGCTELPILCEIYKQDINNINIYDPLLLGLKKMRKEYDNEKNIDVWCL